MLNLSVTDFGPIKAGHVSLRPLTVLIGPNNAGKSYLARLTYALLSPFGRPLRILRFFSHEIAFALPHGLELKLTAEEKKWLRDRIKNKEDISIEQFPEKIKRKLNSAAKNFIEELAGPLSEQLERCFGCELAELPRKTLKESFRLSVEQPNPFLKIELVLSDGKLRVSRQDWQLGPIEPIKAGLRVPLDELGYFFSTRLLQNIFRTFFIPTYYFPAARSGILQGHRLLASVWVRQLPLVGMKRFDVPRLSGEVADFISNLLSLEKRRISQKVAQVGDFIASEVCKGKIDLQAGEAKVEYPEIYYVSEERNFPLHRTSSMISELAPIILFLKYVVREGDLLIIEEPEAHLHPDNQRVFARAVTKLIRIGVRVLITTHSDYFLHQISNFVRLGQAAEARRKFGYGEEDYLRADEVAAYLFYFDEARDGTLIKELEVTSEEGIPEDEFTAIAEEIYDETVRLERSRPKN